MSARQKDRKRDSLGRFANENRSKSAAPTSIPDLPQVPSASLSNAPWEEKYHLVFSNFHQKTLSATKALFRSRPSQLPEADRMRAFEEWINEASHAYKMDVPPIIWDEEAKFAGGGFYTPQRHTITLDPEKPSITTLLHEFRHALQTKNKGPRRVSEDIEIDARAWSLSLYYQTRPSLFTRLVKENRIFHINPNVFN